MLVPLLCLANVASAHTIPHPRPARVCASILVAPGQPMAAERIRIQSPAETADFVRDAKLEGFRLDARVSNVRTTKDHQGRSQLLGELGGRTVFLKLYFPWTETIEFSGQRVSRIRREAAFLKILDDLAVSPRFLGIVQIKKRPALVLEYLPDAIFFKRGQPQLPPRRLPGHLKTTVREQLGHLVDTLHRHGIMPYDLQVLITDAGRVVVIDTANYVLYDEDARGGREPQTRFTDEALTQLFSSAGT